MCVERYTLSWTVPKKRFVEQHIYKKGFLIKQFSSYSFDRRPTCCFHIRIRYLFAKGKVCLVTYKIHTIHALSRISISQKYMYCVAACNKYVQWKYNARGWGWGHIAYLHLCESAKPYYNNCTATLHNPMGLEFTFWFAYRNEETTHKKKRRIL